MINQALESFPDNCYHIVNKFFIKRDEIIFTSEVKSKKSTLFHPKKRKAISGKLKAVI